MNRQWLTFICLFLGGVALVKGEAHLSFTDEVKDCKAEIYALKSSARHSVTKIIKTDSDNLFGTYLDQCRASLDVLFGRAHADNTYEDFLKQSKSRIERFKNRRVDSKYWYYLLGEMEFQVALVSAAQHSDYNAAKHVRLALIYLTKCRKQYPDFYGPVKTLAVIKETVDALPSGYQKLVKVVGFDVSELPDRLALQKMLDSKKAAEDPEYELEAKYFLALMDYYLLNDADAAWEQIDAITQNVEENLLKTLMRANFAIKCRRHNEAANCFWYEPTTTTGFVTAPVMLYYRGLFASSQLKYAAGSFALYRKVGGKTYTANANLYSYYTYYLQGVGHEKWADLSLQAILRQKNSLSEQDKNAVKLAKSYRKTPPNKRLLKSRLLFDGGYYTRALDSLGDFKEKDYPTQAQKLEYNYRKGRIYQELNKPELAILFYKEVLKKMEGSSDYYASYSALYIAEILEDLGRKNEAEEAFKQAIEVCKNRQYSKTVELKAKAGLRRLKE